MVNEGYEMTATSEKMTARLGCDWHARHRGLVLGENRRMDGSTKVPRCFIEGMSNYGPYKVGQLGF